MLESKLGSEGCPPRATNLRGLRWTLASLLSGREQTASRPSATGSLNNSPRQEPPHILLSHGLITQSYSRAVRRRRLHTSDPPTADQRRGEPRRASGNDYESSGGPERPTTCTSAVLRFGRGKTRGNKKSEGPGQGGGEAGPGTGYRWDGPSPKGRGLGRGRGSRGGANAKAERAEVGSRSTEKRMKRVCSLEAVLGNAQPVI